MNEAQFKQDLEANGYGAAEVIEREAGYNNDMHTHDFGASVFILEGEITVTTEENSTTCRAGDTFALDAEVLHRETIGDQGVRLLLGRR